MPDVNTVVGTCIAMWNGRDAARRRELVAATLSQKRPTSIRTKTHEVLDDQLGRRVHRDVLLAAHHRQPRPG